MARILELLAVAVAVTTIVEQGTCQTLTAAEGSHVVQIGQTLPDGRVDLICGGSYLGKNVVILGAHCTNRNGRQPDIARFQRPTGGATFDLRIANFTVHYRYKPQFDYHNMAIAFLDRDPRTISRATKPACVIQRHLAANSAVQLIGPRTTSSGSGNRLEKTNLLAVSSEKCHEYYNPSRKLRFGVLLCCFCARNINTTQCTQQHSAPLQLMVQRPGKQVPFLVGHKSIGKSCGTASPAVYTRYGSYFEWIETVTGISLNEQDCIYRY